MPNSTRRLSIHRGRFIAIPFADPSWHNTGRQVLDVWVLDTVTARLTHLPATPAYVSLKRTSIAWTHDGRLVLLGQEDERAFVGVWRPGQKRLSLKTVRLPVRDGASDAFAPIRYRGSGVSSMRSDTSQRRSAASGSRA